MWTFNEALTKTQVFKSFFMTTSLNWTFPQTTFSNNYKSLLWLDELNENSYNVRITTAMDYVEKGNFWQATEDLKY